MNIIYKKSFKKSYCITILQVVKDSGYCRSKDNILKCAYLDTKGGNLFCRLFTDTIIESNSLFVCDYIYTPTYLGNP